MGLTWDLPGFDLDRFVRETLAEDLGVGLPGGGHDVTAESVIPAEARFSGVMDSRDSIVVAGRPAAAAYFRALDPAIEIEAGQIERRCGHGATACSRRASPASGRGA